MAKAGFSFWVLDGLFLSSVCAVVTTPCDAAVKQLFGVNEVTQIPRAAFPSICPFPIDVLSGKMGFIPLPWWGITSHWWGELRGQEEKSQWISVPGVPVLGFLALWPTPVNYPASWSEMESLEQLCGQHLPWWELSLSAVSPQGSWKSVVIWQQVTDLAGWDLEEKRWPGFFHSWTPMSLKWEGERRKKPRIDLCTRKTEERYKTKSQGNLTAPTSLQP